MKLKEKIETVQTVVTTIGIIIGGLWTYNIFIKERHNYPHANLQLEVSHVGLSSQINLLRITTVVTNSGTSKLDLKEATIRIQQIKPVLDCTGTPSCATDQVNDALNRIEQQLDKFTWPMISQRRKIWKNAIEIEPKEKEKLDFEFAIPSNVKHVRIYTFHKNERKFKRKGGDYGWGLSSYYNFESDQKQEETLDS